MQANNCSVRVAITESALKFVGRNSFEALLYEEDDEGVYDSLLTIPHGSPPGEVHVRWGKWADAIVIAPATASTISNLWLGAYNSTVTLTAAMILPTKWFIVPGMAEEMWSQPATFRNISALKDWGAHTLGPVDGLVSSGDT